MLVVIAGMHRSGSTALYNLVRLTLLHAGKSVFGCSWEDHKITRPVDFEVVKTHQADEYLRKRADAIFLSHRDMVELAESAVNFGLVGKDTKSVLSFLMSEVATFRYYYETGKRKKRVPTKVFRYHDVLWARANIVYTVADVFNVGADYERVLADFEKIRNYRGFKKFDPVTLMHKKHIKRHKIKLDDETVREINARYSGW